MPPQTSIAKSKSAEIAALVAALLSHYWTADDLIATRERQVEDWIEDLIEFPVAAVEEACREYRRRSGGRRPIPGDVRALCMEIHGDALNALGLEAWDEVEIMRRADSYARSHGFSDIADFQAHGHSAVMWLPGGKRRRFEANKPHTSIDFSKNNPPPREFKFTQQELDERAQWAELKGYPSWDDFLQAIQRGAESVLPFLDWSRAQRGQSPLAHVKGFKTLGEALNPKDAF